MYEQTFAMNTKKNFNLSLESNRKSIKWTGHSGYSVDFNY